VRGADLNVGSMDNAGSMDKVMPLGKQEVQKIVSDYIKERDEKKADETKTKKEEADKGFEVGKDLGLTARWTGHQPWLETKDRAFRIHVGGRTQFDIVGVTAPDNVQFGVGGIGRYDDAINFRRARLEIDGWLWEVVDFFWEYDFLNTFDDDPANPALRTDAANHPVPTDLWMGINHIPWIGLIRFGNMKPPIGFEHLTSSRYLQFLERSFQFDAFIEDGNNGFSPGIQIANWTEDERVTWQFGIWKHTRSIFGWNVGDGEYSVVGRVTGTPYYEDNGRFMVHLGLGALHRDGDDGIFRFRARPLLRNGPAVLHNVVAVARLEASSHDQLAPEFYCNWGPFSVQAEYNANWVHNPRLFTSPTVTTPAPSGRGTYFAQGAYVEVGYFLTGENRQYVRTPEHSSGTATTRVIPYRNFFWVPGESCNLFSAGAWQVCARYSWLDLNNGVINGGLLNDFTFGVNWFLNPNAKLQWNYSYGHRNVPGGTSDGAFQGFGFRFACDF
jgi:phosphate-selective porin OprO/OprP